MSVPYTGEEISLAQPDSDFPITAAQLAGNFVETLCYGIYFTTCFFCARTLLFTNSGKDAYSERWRKPREIRWFMVFVAVILFIVSSFDTAIGLYHNIQAFVLYKGGEEPAELLTDISSWVNISRSLAQVINMIVGDFVLIYRCYIVYARRKRAVLLSFILYLGGIAMAIKLIQVEFTLDHARILLNSSEIKPWWTAFFAITMVQNTSTTGLLIWRIWRVEKQSERYRTKPKYSNNSGSSGSTAVNGTGTAPLRRVIRVIAESGFGYTLVVFMTFVVSLCNSNALYPTSNAALQATGIAFNVIIVRSSARRDEQFTVYDQQERATLTTEGGGRLGVQLRSFISGRGKDDNTSMGMHSMNPHSRHGRGMSEDGGSDTGKGFGHLPVNVQVTFKTETSAELDDSITSRVGAAYGDPEAGMFDRDAKR